MRKWLWLLLLPLLLGFSIQHWHMKIAKSRVAAGGGAIALNALTSGSDGTDRTGTGDPYTTASITITANRLALLAVAGRRSTSTATAPAIAGTLSATWVLVDSEEATGGEAPLLRWIFLFRTMVGSNQTGTITIDPPSGHTWTDAAWSVSEFSGVDTGGTNGSGAVVQSAKNHLTGSDTTLTVTLGAFANANNRPYLAAAPGVAASEDFVPESGYTQIHEDNALAQQQVFTMWHDATAELTPTFTWTTSDSDVGAVAIEIKQGT